MTGRRLVKPKEELTRIQRDEFAGSELFLVACNGQQITQVLVLFFLAGHLRGKALLIQQCLPSSLRIDTSANFDRQH